MYQALPNHWYYTTFIRLADMVVSVCAWLTNFEPVLVPPPVDDHVEEKVDEYFKSVLDSESDIDYDADTESNDLVIRDFWTQLILSLSLTHSLNPLS